MENEELYNIEFTKKKLNEYLKKGIETEFVIKIRGNDYMIIPLKNKISFQWIGKSKEFYYNNVEELFNSKLINGIILNNDWDSIEDIYYY